jgi:hypothetical protein
MMSRIWLCVASSNGKRQMWWKCISKEGLQNGMDIINFLHCGGQLIPEFSGFWKLEHEFGFKFQPIECLYFLACQQSNRVCDIVRAGLVGCSLCGVCKQTSFQTKKQIGWWKLNVIIVIHFVVSVELCGWERVWCVVCWRGTIEVSVQFRTN